MESGNRRTVERRHAENSHRLSYAEAVNWASQRAELWNAHDAHGLTVSHSSDCVVRSALAGIVHGAGEVEVLYQRWFEAFPDLRYRSEHIFTDGQWIAEFWTIRGTQQGVFLGLASTQKRLRISGASLYEFVEGQIVFEQRVVDFTGVLADALNETP